MEMPLTGAMQMEESKSRKFIITGVITDDTPIFGTTHGKFKQILEKRFQERFTKIPEAREKRKDEGSKEK
jgi:hypothetical protein